MRRAKLIGHGESSTVRLLGDSSEKASTPAVSSSGMRYRPILELGEGGMAKIALARAEGAAGFTKLVVLKSLRASHLENESIRRMFADEARLSARFNHPNLVQVQEVNLSADVPFLVMEYLDGKPLSALRAVDRVTLAMRLAILSEVLSGLQYAHGLLHFDGTPLGIVHRDVSPQNVFVTYEGAVKVLDFGIAKVVTNDARTEVGEVKGKLAYMAPEQLLGGEVDRRADIFAVGSMAWEAAIGKRMWHGLSEPRLMHRLAKLEIPRPSEHGPVDPELEAIIVKATAGRASERFESARALQEELDRYRARFEEDSSLRRIGVVLSEVYAEERRRNSVLIHAALRETPPPPPSAGDTNEALDTRTGRSTRARWGIFGLLLLLAGTAVSLRGLRRAAPPPSGVTAAASHSASTRLGNDPAVSAVPSNAAPRVLDLGTIAEAAASVPPATNPRVRPARSAGAPGAVRPRADSSARAPVSPETELRCDPPYYFSAGIKTYKPECL